MFIKKFGEHFGMPKLSEKTETYIQDDWQLNFHKFNFKA